MACSILVVSEDGVEGVWLEGCTLTFEEFVLELDPMKTKSMEESLKQVHAH